jgi:DNA-binding NarL/FixJ family response regulator
VSEKSVKFSPREIEIVKLLAETAMSDKELADRLGLRCSTFRNYLRTISRKLQKHMSRSTSLNRTEIALYAISNGYADVNLVFSKYQKAGEGMAVCSPS